MKTNEKKSNALFSLMARLAAIGAVVCLAASGVALAAGTNAPASTVSAPKPAVKADKKAKAKPVKELSGAELYAVNCNRCHAERYPAEFTEDQWKTLMLHMRVRANLPAKQARLILKYLQDESGHY